MKVLKLLIRVSLITGVFCCTFYTNLFVLCGQLLSPHHYYYDWVLASQMYNSYKTSDKISIIEVSRNSKLDDVLKTVLNYHPKVIAVSYYNSIDSATVFAINELAEEFSDGSRIVFMDDMSTDSIHTIPSILNRNDKISHGVFKTGEESDAFREAINCVTHNGQKRFSFSVEVAKMYASDSLDVESIPNSHHIKYKRGNRNIDFFSFETDIKSGEYMPALFKDKIVLLARDEFQCEKIKSPLNMDDTKADMSYAVVLANIIEGLVERDIPNELDLTTQYLIGILLMILNISLFWRMSSYLKNEDIYYFALLLLGVELSLLFMVGGLVFLKWNIHISEMESVTKFAIFSALALPFFSIRER